MPGALSSRSRKLVAGAIVGVVVGIASALVAWVRPLITERGELWTYDLRARRAARAEMASKDVVLIDISEEDLRAVEDHMDLTWPWPRELYAYLVDYVAQGNSRAIAFDFIFHDRGLGVNDLETFADSMRKSGRAVIGLQTMRTPAPPAPAPGPFGARLRSFASRDEALAAARRLLTWNTHVFVHDKTVHYGGKDSATEVEQLFARLSGQDSLRDLFLPETPPADGTEPEPVPPTPARLGPEVLAAALTAEALVRERHGLALPSSGYPEQPSMIPPLAILASGATRVGNVAQLTDPDGIVRRHAPFVRVGDRTYPSLPLAAWMVAHPDARPQDLRVPLGEDGRAMLRFHGAQDVYRHYSAYRILRSMQQIAEGAPPEIPASEFAGKYVVVSATAHALRDIRPTPVSQVHLGAAVNATFLDNLLQGTFIERTPRGVDAAIALALALVFALTMMLIWNLIPHSATALVATVVVTALLLGGYFLLAAHLYASNGLWLPVAVPLGGAIVATLSALLVASALERQGRRFVQEALGRYTSDELVKALVEHPEYLSLEWGEQRPMSVYFSDIAGFTTISEGLEPKRLVALLNEYLTEMTDLILAHGGVVDKYIGDAIMAFWGAPIAEPDHAKKAVTCAIAMRDRCLELRAKWERDYGQIVLARAGVNSGDAVVGNMGSRHKYNYTVMGDMVNLASRLEGANKPYGTLLMISEFTYEKVKDTILARELDKLTVKGKEQPITVYEVIAEKAKVEPGKAELVRRFHEGLALYRERRFADASRVFASLADDGPSRLYVERCAIFEKHPPAPDWDGVWHLKEK